MCPLVGEVVSHGLIEKSKSLDQRLAASTWDQGKYLPYSFKYPACFTVAFTTGDECGFVSTSVSYEWVEPVRSVVKLWPGRISELSRWKARKLPCGWRAQAGPRAGFCLDHHAVYSCHVLLWYFHGMSTGHTKYDVSESKPALSLLRCLGDVP